MKSLSSFEAVPGSVVSLRLTGEQARLLAPLVLQAADGGENLIFFAVTVPFWSLQDESVVWELQATLMPARLGHKIRKLVTEAKVQ